MEEMLGGTPLTDQFHVTRHLFKKHFELVIFNGLIVYSPWVQTSEMWQTSNKLDSSAVRSLDVE
jgi:hypothetical protein